MEGTDFILHGMDGSVRKISAEELEDILKNKNKQNDALNSILKNKEVPPVIGIEGGTPTPINIPRLIHVMKLVEK